MKHFVSIARELGVASEASFEWDVESLGFDKESSSNIVCESSADGGLILVYSRMFSLACRPDQS